MQTTCAQPSGEVCSEDQPGTIFSCVHAPFISFAGLTMAPYWTARCDTTPPRNLVRPGPVFCEDVCVATSGEGIGTGILPSTRLGQELTQQELESRLWAAANSLRGPVDPADFKSYVFPLLFFKWASDTWDLEHAAAVTGFRQ